MAAASAGLEIFRASPKYAELTSCIILVIKPGSPAIISPISATEASSERNFCTTSL